MARPILIHVTICGQPDRTAQQGSRLRLYRSRRQKRPAMKSFSNSWHITYALLAVQAVIGGALVAAIRHGIAEYSRLEGARRTEMNEFHDGLVAQVESLAEKSGMLNSADLCSVRFRLRMADSRAFPSEAYSIRARLISTDPGALPIDHFLRNSTLEFGLLPPGTYRLQLSVPDSYVLKHEFDVLPGVPVDRMVRCPNRTPADFSQAVDLVWPDAAAVDDVVAVLDVRRDAATLGEWTWQPTENGSIRVVAAGVQESIPNDEELE